MRCAPIARHPPFILGWVDLRKKREWKCSDFLWCCCTLRKWHKTTPLRRAMWSFCSAIVMNSSSTRHHDGIISGSTESRAKLKHSVHSPSSTSSNEKSYRSGVYMVKKISLAVYQRSHIQRKKTLREVLYIHRRRDAELKE